MQKKSPKLAKDAKAVQAAHKETVRSIIAYQDTLVSWVDEEGRLQIGSYVEFLLARGA
jgi:hypothetical protein